MEIRLVPLRERWEDIPYLAAVFLREVTGRLRRPLIGMTAAAERTLLQAPWPGNVRELRNVIERACLLSDGKCSASATYSRRCRLRLTHRCPRW
jgi:DNA-binding NtrC family response regulator